MRHVLLRNSLWCEISETLSLYANSTVPREWYVNWSASHMNTYTYDRIFGHHCPVDLLAWRRKATSSNNAHYNGIHVLVIIFRRYASPNLWSDYNFKSILMNENYRIFDQNFSGNLFRQLFHGEQASMTYSTGVYLGHEASECSFHNLTLCHRKSDNQYIWYILILIGFTEMPPAWNTFRKVHNSIYHIILVKIQLWRARLIIPENNTYAFVPWLQFCLYE